MNTENANQNQKTENSIPKKGMLIGEKLITRSKDGKLTLTNYRIRFDDLGDYGSKEFVSIMLEKISSIRIYKKSKPLYLILGILIMLSFFSGFYGRDLKFAPIIIGGVLILFYLLTRKHIVSIASDGGDAIIVETTQYQPKDLIDFIDKIEQAKNERVYGRKNNNSDISNKTTASKHANSNIKKKSLNDGNIEKIQK